jgi:peptidoglycan/LPS O-acetylase OafA/YrhL
MGLLRTLLAITVVFAHSPLNGGFVFVGGRNAVQLFYVISGFLITHVINASSAYHDPLKFYTNRILRIYPVYYVVLLLTALTLPQLLGQAWEVVQAGPTAAGVLVTLSNLSLVGQDWVMFSGVRDGALAFVSDFNLSEVLLYKGLLIPQAWTLGVELSFYAIAPLVLRWPNRILSLFLLSLAVRAIIVLQGLGMSDPWTYRFFPAELSFFLLGALVDLYLLPWVKRWVARPELRSLPKLGTAFCVALVAVYFLLPGSELVKTGLLFACFVPLLPLTFLYQGKSRLDKSIGALSYPIYICHMLVILNLERTGYERLGSPLLITLINVAVTVLAAYLLNKYVGERFENLRQAIKTGS